ncbi:MAG: hypothetical protein R2991_09090 [Thermoanaerobaculia bacterium]
MRIGRILLAAGVLAGTVYWANCSPVSMSPTLRNVLRRLLRG